MSDEHNIKCFLGTVIQSVNKADEPLALANRNRSRCHSEPAPDDPHATMHVLRVPVEALMVVEDKAVNKRRK